MRVAVTGGAGFIGHHLVRLLLAEGHEVTVVDNLRRSSFERPGLAGARCIEGDVRALAHCRLAVAGSDAVVHLAAQSNVMGSHADPDYAFETNVTGTWNVAMAARDEGVGHLVFSSSREVYGEPDALPVPESAPVRPHNLYGASKAAAEMLLAGLPDGAPRVSILRFANVIGPGDSGRVVPLWLQNAREGAPLRVYGGSQVMDLIPVDAACRAIANTLSRGPLDGPVNVGSGVPTAILDLAAHIIQLTGGVSCTEIVPARSVEVTRFFASTGRMQAILGVVPPQRPLEAIEVDW